MRSSNGNAADYDAPAGGYYPDIVGVPWFSRFSTAGEGESLFEILYDLGSGLSEAAPWQDPRHLRWFRQLVSALGSLDDEEEQAEALHGSTVRRHLEPMWGILVVNRYRSSTEPTQNDGSEEASRRIKGMTAQSGLSQLLDEVVRRLQAIPKVRKVAVRTDGSGKRAVLSVFVQMPEYDRDVMDQLVDVEMDMDREAWSRGYVLEYMHLPLPHVDDSSLPERDPSEYLG